MREDGGYAKIILACARPSSNMDPYAVTAKLVDTCCAQPVVPAVHPGSFSR